jgi:hypothetical protein
MAAMSNFLESELLDHVLNTNSWASPATVHVGIHNTDPTDADSGTEVTGGAYARVAMTGGSAWTISGTTPTQASNAGPIAFPTATDGTWGTATHFGIYDAATTGNLLIHGVLTDPKDIGDGDTFEFAIGNLVVEFA